MTLEIIDLHVEVEGAKIIKGINLVFNPGQIHVLMGPNGSGKSTLVNTIMGHPSYKITQGRIILDGKDITTEKIELRAKAGLFLSLQNPPSVSGVTISNFLRSALNSLRGEKISVIKFNSLLKEKMALLGLDPAFGKRYLNEGFSGGEKKRSEILQLLLLEAKYALLDETDSGLDVDGIKMVAENILQIKKNSPIGVVVITHYGRFLEHLNPDQVSIISQGRIIATGGHELAKRIELEGFGSAVSGVKD
ncbi:MAG TPA: Fe-S cluster assembly ATPase SufC [Candidatus Nanoarchaeia archaeon]|nr:Fe-S cluster assembly ATPase SufC [Candidatus Nanoarchaeia archaeon]